jgi:hypothetical protein
MRVGTKAFFHANLSRVAERVWALFCVLLFPRNYTIHAGKQAIVSPLILSDLETNSCQAYSTCLWNFVPTSVLWPSSMLRWVRLCPYKHVVTLVRGDASDTTPYLSGSGWQLILGSGGTEDQSTALLFEVAAATAQVEEALQLLEPLCVALANDTRH